MDPFEQDWGEVTLEGYDRNANQAMHILNFFMQTASSRKLAMIFLIGRVVWFSKHLPKGCSHRIRIDTGGQSVSVMVLNKWRQSVLDKLYTKIPHVTVEIEFLV